MKATMSKTYFKEVDGKELFCKLKEASNFDTRTVMFQAKLAQMITGRFSINELKGINLKQLDNVTFYEILFDKLNEQEWTPNHDNMKLIGTAMGHIHSFAYHNRSLLNLPVKSEPYDNMDKWLYIPKTDDRIKEFYQKRTQVFATNEAFNIAQPKIPLHRDFKLHNIIFDGEKYVLIDFDFAAIDYVSIEIMGFIVDVIKYGIEYVKTFFEYYHKTIDIPNISRSYVSDYIAYLCTNTFPFYLQDKISKESMDDLINYRNNCLDVITNNKEILNQVIQESNVRN